MTSLEIAEMCNKRHDNVMRDIKEKLLPKISHLKNEESVFKVKTSTYENSRSKTYDMYVLNKYAANAFVANYKLEHAMLVVEHIHCLELKVEQQQKQLDIMKNIVWQVINGQAYISQEQALKMSGIKHPRLFMKYLKGSTKFYDSVVNEREFLKYKQCNKHGDRWWKFTKEGFQWLLDGQTKLNDWVERQKDLEKQRKVLPC